MKKNLIFVCCMAVLLLMPSCASRKDIVYLQDMVMGERYPYDVKNEAVIHLNDRLSITVTCKKQELAVPFNAYGKSIQVDPNGNVTTGSTGDASKGYRVNVDGNIEFPILGKLHVQGLKVSEVTELIKRRIIDGGYIKDPQVSLEFLNFKYTVLGAVNGKGTFSVEDDRITLLEAIAKAGDLAPNAQIDKVAVIREINGEREIFYHDLRTKDLFMSPCYYLQQNDIVYVEPKKQDKDKSELGWKITSTLISVASMVTSLLWVLLRNK